MNLLLKKISTPLSLKLFLLAFCSIGNLLFASLPTDLTKKILCPVCELEYSEFYHSPKLSVKSRVRLDGRMAGEKMPIPGECSLCRGVFMQTNFQNADQNLLKTFIWSDEFRNFRNADPWFRRALIIEKISKDRFDKGMAFLKSYWANESEKEIAGISLEKSLKYFNEFTLLQKNPDERTMDAELKVGELLRLLERFNDAEIHFHELKKDPRFKISFFPRLIEYELKLISNHNSAPSFLPEGNALHLAVKEGDREKVAALLSQKGLVNEINSDGKTPIAIALEANNVVLARLLAKNGAALKKVDLKENAIFHFPEIFEKGLTIGEFKTPGELINLKNSEGFTPLLLAIKRGNLSFANELLELGADISVTDSNGNNPFHLLAVAENFCSKQFCKQLLSHGASVNGRNFSDETPLFLAVKKGNPEVVKKMISLGAKVDARLPDGRTSVFFAEKQEVLDLLVRAGADLLLKNNAGHTAFFEARLEGNPKKIEILKNTGLFGAKPKIFKVGNFKGSIFDAIRKGKTEAAIEMLNRDANLINFKEFTLGESPLHIAVLKENMGLTKALLKMGARVNIENDFGRTPLHYAAMLNDLSFLQVLVEKKGNIFKLDFKGNTPLHEAARAGRQSCYDFLVKCGASPQTRNDNGESAVVLFNGFKEMH